RRDQGHLVADATRRVLADLDALDVAQVQHLAALHQGVRQSERLGARHAARANGHQPGGHLVVGNRPGQVAVEQEADLVFAVLRTVALPGDDLQRLHQAGRTQTLLAVSWLMVTSRSAAATVTVRPTSSTSIMARRAPGTRRRSRR